MKKKILVLLAILAALTLVFVACRNDPTPEETTVATEAPTDPVETPTDAPTEAPTTPDETPTEEITTPEETPTTEEVTTEAPTEPELPYKTPAEAGQINAALDTFYVNGQMYFPEDGGAGDKLTAIQNTLTYGIEEACQSITLRGWIGFPQAIDSFGYFVNDGDFVYDPAFAVFTEDAVKQPENGGEFGSRFEITVPMNGSDAKVGFVVKLADGTVVLIRDFVNVVIEKTDWFGSDIVVHQSQDQVYIGTAAAATGPENFFAPLTPENPSGGFDNWDKIAVIQDKSIEHITYWGWVAVKGEVGRFGYKIDGGEAVFDPAFAVEAEKGVMDAAASVNADTASRMKVSIHIAGLVGEGHRITVLYQAPDTPGEGDAVVPGAVLVLGEFTVNMPAPVVIPDTTLNITVNASDNFNADSAVDATVALPESNLKDLFTTVTHAGGDAGVAINAEGGAYFKAQGFSEAFRKMDGTYVYTVHSIGSAQKKMASFFVRGTRMVHSVDLPAADPDNGLFPINNYYETDGQPSGHAGAGIQIWNHKRLFLGIKYYDEAAQTRIGTAYWLIEVDCQNKDVQVIDDGNKVYITVDGVLAATVELIGSGVYHDDLTVDEGVAFCEKAVVTIYHALKEEYGFPLDENGQCVIEKPLVVDTPASDVGLATRTGSLDFSSISIAPLSTVEIPVPAGTEGDPATFSVCADNVRTWVGDTATDLCTQEAHKYMETVNGEVDITGLDYVSFRGWANPTRGGIEIDQFGYRIGDGEAVFSPDFRQDEPELKAALNSQYAERYENIKIPVADLTVGSYEITLLVRDTKGMIYVMNGSWGGTITLVKADPAAGV